MEEYNLEELKKEYEEFEKKIQYAYNEIGELRNKKTDEKVGKLDKKEYLLVCDYITKYIQYKILKDYNFIPMYVPSDNLSNFYIRRKDIPQCEIYVSKNFQIFKKCICIIQGTGGVRAGLWARSVCINDNLYLGSIIPYIEKFQKDFSIIVLNPNERFDKKNKKIPELQTMEDHCKYIYKNIIKTNLNIEELYIIAHSMGGYCTIEILLENEEDLLNGKIKKIAFTDSVHGDSYLKLSDKAQLKLKEITRDFIGSQKPLGEFIYSGDESGNGVDCYSSGNPKHEYTSGCAIEEVYKWIIGNEKKEDKTEKEDEKNNKKETKENDSLK